MITIFTDGASRGNPGPGGWAAIIFDNEKVVEIGDREEHTTNNRMELKAAIEGLKFANNMTPPQPLPLGEGKKGRGICIHTDSKYVMMGITEWIHNWQKKNWKTAGKKKVLNQDLWQELLAVSSGLNVKWKYVEGHAGHKLNERADEIATSFANSLSPALYDGPRKKYK